METGGQVETDLGQLKLDRRTAFGDKPESSGRYIDRLDSSLEGADYAVLVSTLKMDH